MDKILHTRQPYYETETGVYLGDSFDFCRKWTGKQDMIFADPYFLSNDGRPARAENGLRE
ncbi:MAG: hypothetical protein ACLUOI_18690 [Eisenbergiella sp.]